MNLRDLIKSKSIAVIGDAILDQYVYGKVYRVSPEAPVPVVLREKEVYCLGGAANVAQNITSFGSSCHLISVVGEDENAEVLTRLCNDKGITSILIRDNRPTTTKTRIIGNGHQITRIDNEISVDISKKIEKKVIGVVESLVQSIDGLIIQDYGKGMITKSLIRSIIKICVKNGVPVLTDPKDSDFSKYAGSTILKPNLSEFKSGMGIPQEKNLTNRAIAEKAIELREKFDVEYAFITMSERGVLLDSSSYSGYAEGYPIEIVDVSGAGDTVSATFMLLFSAGISLGDCIHISNLSGSLVCKISGAVPVDPSHIFRQITKDGSVVSMADGSPILI